MARALNDGQSAIMDLREQADSDIAAGVETLNIALAQVEALNGDIARARSQGNDTAALLDQRQRAIDSIAEAVPVREVDRGNGRVALMTSSGTMLLDGTAPRIGFAPAAVITPGMTLAGGGAVRADREWCPGSRRHGGRWTWRRQPRGLQAARRDVAEAQITLDAVARDLIERVQDPAIDPSLGLARRACSPMTARPSAPPTRSGSPAGSPSTRRSIRPGAAAFTGCAMVWVRRPRARR